VSYAVILGTIALSQAAFIVVLLALLVLNRGRQATRRQWRDQAEQTVGEVLNRWLVADGTVDDVLAALRQMPPAVALEQASVLVTLRLAPAQWSELARALRAEPWVRRLLARHRSRLWWRRLRAARMLAVVAEEADRPVLRRLLADAHPAVQSVATASLARICDGELVAVVLDELPRLPTVARRLQMSALRDVWQLTVPALVERLRRHPAPKAHELTAWVYVAEKLAVPECLEAVVPLCAHRDAEVRLGAARALQKRFHPDTATVLLPLLGDADWRVRAQAARALGALGDPATLVPLDRALTDTSWWVRFRAALSLAQLGEPGRRALRLARERDDRYAADMATMVSGLSDGGILELAEV
jgi:hypothetical protein